MCWLLESWPAELVAWSYTWSLGPSLTAVLVGGWEPGFPPRSDLLVWEARASRARLAACDDPVGWAAVERLSRSDVVCCDYLA